MLLVTTSPFHLDADLLQQCNTMLQLPPFEFAQAEVNAAKKHLDIKRQVQKEKELVKLIKEKDPAQVSGLLLCFAPMILLVP